MENTCREAAGSPTKPYPHHRASRAPVPSWQGRCWARQGMLGPGAYKGLPRVRETSVEMRQGPDEEIQLCPSRGPAVPCPPSTASNSALAT